VERIEVMAPRPNGELSTLAIVFLFLPVPSTGFSMSKPSRAVAKRLEQLSRLISASMITSASATSISVIVSSVASSWVVSSYSSLTH